MSGGEFLDGTNLIRRIARDTDVVVSFEYQLDIAELERVGVAEFGYSTCGGDDLVDEIVGELKDCLMYRDLRFRVRLY